MALNDEIFAGLRDSRRPLVVCDIDEVVLEFIEPFGLYLESVNHRLHADSFKLHGNIRAIEGGAHADKAMVAEFLENFFATQDRWQKPVLDAAGVLSRLQADADVIFLTAMPPRHHELRRGLLDAAGLHFPMISTEEPKGPVVAALIGDRGVRSAFIDDIAYNHHSVREQVPDCLLVHLMANQTFRTMLPALDDDIVRAADWLAAERLIRTHFS